MDRASVKEIGAHRYVTMSGGALRIGLTVGGMAAGSDGLEYVPSRVEFVRVNYWDPHMGTNFRRLNAEYEWLQGMLPGMDGMKGLKYAQGALANVHAACSERTRERLEEMTC